MAEFTKVDLNVNQDKIALIKEDIKKRAQADNDFISIIKGKGVSQEAFEEGLLYIDEFITGKVACVDCAGLNKCTQNTEGMQPYIKVVAGKIVNSLNPCKYYLDANIGIDFVDNYASRYFGKELLRAEIDDIEIKTADRADLQLQLLKIVTNYPEIKDGIFVHGAPGVGKTFIMAAFTNTLAKKGIKVGNVFVPELIADIKASSTAEFVEKSKMKKRVEAIKKSKVLVLDDIGGEKIDAWGRDDILLPIINYRIENKLQTFFTSNYSIEDLLKRYGKAGANIEAIRLVDRIRALAKPISIAGKSRR